MTKFETYQIVVGTYLTFRNKEDKIIKCVNHKPEKIEKYIYRIKDRIFSLDRSTLMLCCLYVNFKYSPRSIDKMISVLNEIFFEDISDFKVQLKTFKSVYKIQIENNKFKNLEEVFNLYIKKEINFMSFYHLIKDKELNSRNFTLIFSKVKKLMLYLERHLKD